MIPVIATFVLPALDHRFGWSNVPSWLAIGGDILILVGMWMVYRVYKENEFGATVVKVTADQKVIRPVPMPSCGIRCIRLRRCTSLDSHSLSAPIGLIASVLLTILIFVVRLFDEEKFLAKDLPGIRGI